MAEKSTSWLRNAAIWVLCMALFALVMYFKSQSGAIGPITPEAGREILQKCQAQVEAINAELVAVEGSRSRSTEKEVSDRIRELNAQKSQILDYSSRVIGQLNKQEEQVQRKKP